METVPETGAGGVRPQPGPVFHRRTISAHSLDQALAHAVQRLSGRHPNVPVVELRDLIEGEAVALSANAGIETFVPLLAERRAEAALRRRARGTESEPAPGRSTRRPAA